MNALRSLYHKFRIQRAANAVICSVSGAVLGMAAAASFYFFSTGIQISQ